MFFYWDKLAAGQPRTGAGLVVQLLKDPRKRLTINLLRGVILFEVLPYGVNSTSQWEVKLTLMLSSASISLRLFQPPFSISLF